MIYVLAYAIQRKGRLPSASEAEMVDAEKVSRLSPLHVRHEATTLLRALLTNSKPRALANTNHSSQSIERQEPKERYENHNMDSVKSGGTRTTSEFN